MDRSSKRILILPFLNIPSGHHQVADSIIEEMQLHETKITCEKAEILSYRYGKMEYFVSAVYLQWIHLFPKFYNWVYRQSVYTNVEKNKKFRLYELLFLRPMEKLMEEVQPDCVICTHSLPSYMLNILKEKNKINIPVINVYTDFFIHRFWGIKHIDFHFISVPEMKEFLLKKGLKEKQIWFTGIPVHHEIKLMNGYDRRENYSSLSILVTGGNLGVGAMEELLKSMKISGKITYYVLCGKNKMLYQKLKKMNNPYLIPVEYITSRKEMNALYESVDGILTKPGGVTISEVLRKRKPIFIYHALPGQEVINLHQLQKLGLVFLLKNWEDIEDRLFHFFNRREDLERLDINVAHYHDQLTDTNLSDVLEQIM